MMGGIGAEYDNAALRSAGMSDADAQIAKAIEESLAGNHGMPASDFNDEDELARILELSKNEK